MQSTIERAMPKRGARTIILPERLGASGISLLLVDFCAAGIAVTLTARLFGEFAGTAIALACLLATGLILGRYSKSFATAATDELYATVAVAIVGGAIGLFVTLGVGRLSWAPLGAFAVWIVLAAAGSFWITRLRRGRRAFVADVGSVDDRTNADSVLTSMTIRFCDVLFSALALVVFLPVLAVVAIAVLVDSGKPVLFRQERIGRNSEPFTMFKFRTMRADSGGAWVRPGDNRITPVGAFLRRTSLDELPQLFNVMRGEMSLVGPRPEMSEYADRFSREERFYSQRHLVRPGITGWAQLLLPRNLQPSDMPVVLRYDLFYVQNRDLLLYVSCLVKTAIEVLAHRAV